MLGFKEFRNAAITMPVSSYCTASGGDSSDWDVRAFKAKLRLRSRTPFLALEVSTAQKGSVLLVTAICTKARCGTAPCPTVLARMLEDTAGARLSCWRGLRNEEGSWPGIMLAHRRQGRPSNVRAASLSSEPGPIDLLTIRAPAPDWFRWALSHPGQSQFVTVAGCRIHFLHWTRAPAID